MLYRVQMLTAFFASISEMASFTAAARICITGEAAADNSRRLVRQVHRASQVLRKSGKHPNQPLRVRFKLRKRARVACLKTGNVHVFLPRQILVAATREHILQWFRAAAFD